MFRSKKYRGLTSGEYLIYLLPRVYSNDMETITLPKEIGSKIKIASKNLGISRDVFTLNAVLFYLQSLKNRINFKRELNMWDQASNDDLLLFEKSL